MADRLRTSYIVVHCAATKPDMDVGAAEIRKWHTDAPPRGNGWADIGYHEVIRRDGTVEHGRDMGAVGAHVKGYNSVSVGICLVGGIDARGRPENNFTKDQMTSLIKLLRAYQTKYPQALIVGHKDLDPGKACPSFDVAPWLREIGF